MINTLARHEDRHVLHHVCWHPPSDGYIKVSVDGYSFDNPCNVDFGDLLRDSNEIWIFVFVIHLSNMFAEL